jgi:hypothetical protein
VIYAQIPGADPSAWQQYGILGLFAFAFVSMFFYVITKTMPAMAESQQKAMADAMLQAGLRDTERRKDFVEALNAARESFIDAIERIDKRFESQEARTESRHLAMIGDIKSLSLMIQKVELAQRGCPVRVPVEDRKPRGDDRGG